VTDKKENSDTIPEENIPIEEIVVSDEVQPIIEPKAEIFASEPTPENEQENYVHHHIRLTLKEIIPSLLIIVIILVWVLFSGQFLKINIAGLSFPASTTDSQLANVLTDKAGGYKLEVSYPDGTIKKYGLSSLGLSLDTKSTIDKLRSNQKKLGNHLTFWKPITAQLVFKKNTATINSFISSATVITVQPPQDASLSLSGGNVVISNAITGKQYGLSNPIPQLLNAADALSPKPIKLTSLAVNPALTSAELEPYKQNLEKTLSQRASFLIGGNTITPTPSDISSWLDITPEDKTKKVDIAVNSGKVLAYIDSIAAPIGRAPKAQVNVTESDGSTQVLIPGANGITITGENSIATTVAANLLSGSGFSETLPVVYQPYETITAGDYPKWIEVDITNKILYAYQNTTLVASYLVTAGAPATPTVTGQYAIYSKYVSQNMQGENVDGSTYFQPNVPWVNYFYKDYAIHGNYWRPTSYFGHVNSSHGCVGVQDNNAEWIYNWAPIGTPVIIHA
jgi:lipoprotein-anchoring transpeptidase ErfK/SrfK